MTGKLIQQTTRIYHPVTRIVINFLDALQVKVTAGTINNTLKDHPDWPSLLCISDSLAKWNISNGAGKTDPAAIEQIPVPFIAYTNNRQEPLVVVTKVSAGIIKTRQKDYRNTIAVNRETFIKNWEGIYLIAEPDENSGEPEYQQQRKKEFVSALMPVAIIALTLTISLWNLCNAIHQTGIIPLTTAGIYIQYFLNIAGLALCALLLWYETDKKNPLLQQVCSAISKGNCNAILTGKASKIFSWLSWSEAGFIYFSGATICLSIVQTQIPAYIAILSTLNVLAIPYIFFSIYYQWKIARQWCLLCIGVQAVLTAGFINITATGLYHTVYAIGTSAIIQVLCIYLFVALIWFTTKPFISSFGKAKVFKRRYLRMKFNTEIFDALLKKQKKITVQTEGLGIDLGNPDATHIIVKVCNPYCGPCSKAHIKLEKILEHRQDLRVKIIFNTKIYDNNPALNPTRHLLSIAGNAKNEKELKKALHDWDSWGNKHKDYTSYASKYPVNGHLLQQDKKIQAMQQWCQLTKIEFTPTIFVNGYQLPEIYDLEDIEYFLQE